MIFNTPTLLLILLSQHNATIEKSKYERKIFLNGTGIKCIYLETEVLRLTQQYIKIGKISKSRKRLQNFHDNGTIKKTHQVSGNGHKDEKCHTKLKTGLLYPR